MAFVIVTAQKLNGKATRRGRNFPKLHSVQQNTPVCFVNRTGCFEIVIFSGDILGFQSSLSKTKAHLCSQWNRERETRAAPAQSKARTSPLSLALPPTLCRLCCAHWCLWGEVPPHPSLQPVNVNDSLICTYFILHFQRIVSASVPTYKAREGARASILSSPACLLELIKVNNVPAEPGY